MFQSQAEPKIKRQESLKIEDTKKWLENSRQKPRAQIPMNSLVLNPVNKMNQPQQQQQISNRSNGLPIENNTKTNNNRQNSSSVLSMYHQRNYYALPPKFSDTKAQVQSTASDRCEISATQNSPPPPLAPRLSSSAKKSFPPPPRPAPLNSVQG